MKIKVIGAGLAGTSASYFLANKGVKVTLVDQKPHLEGPFHSQNFAELVCSNSLKSTSKENACGLLKDEIEKMGSLFIEASKIAKIPSGSDLAVDRNIFSSYIDNKIRNHPNIEIVEEKVEKIDPSEAQIICTGPLSDETFLSSFKTLTQADACSFYDAAAPLVYLSSLDTSKMYFKSRYDKGEGKYLNIPLNKEEYERFSSELARAERVINNDSTHFESCLPIEVIASRGIDSLRFGPLTPKGLNDEEHHPYAVVQLRQDDVANTLYGLVGFQTNLTYKEQKRVFGMLSGMKDAKYARFGLMHRNSYILAPEILNRNLSLKKYPNIFIGGQFSGVEGYVESAASGLLAAYYAYKYLKGERIELIPINTMLGSLVNYLVMSNKKNFAPMNACYGILQNPHKKDRLEAYNDSMESLSEWLKFYE